MDLIGEYDEIEIPPVKPHVTRHRRFAWQCGPCGVLVKVPVKAPAPAVSKATPFGPGIHVLAIYFKGFFRRCPTSAWPARSAIALG